MSNEKRVELGVGEGAWRTGRRGAALSVTALALGVLGCSSNSPSTSADGGPGGDGATCTPPTGYEQVAAPDADVTQEDAHLAMVLDGAGNPMIAWVAYDQSGTKLYFVAYDGATCTWRPRVQIDVVGDVDYTRDREVTMARDPSNGHLGIGYQIVDTSGGTKVMLAQSDDGTTWTSEMVAQRLASEPGSVLRPTVAMKNGKTYYVYYQDYLWAAGGSNSSDSSGFIFGVRSGTSGSFTTTNVPAVAGATLPGCETLPPSIAIDDAGAAGLAFFARTDDATPNLRVVYYSSASGLSVSVFDSQGTQHDGGDVSLVFEGTKPRLAATLERGTNDSNNSRVWFSASNDGSTWSAPVEMPMDGGDAMGPDVSMAAGGNGALTIATNYGGGNGVHTCGAPKLSTSSDDGSGWATCGPVPDPAGQVGYAGGFVQLAYAPSGKRIAGFVATGLGVYVWREP